MIILSLQVFPVGKASTVVVYACSVNKSSVSGTVSPVLFKRTKGRGKKADARLLQHYLIYSINYSGTSKDKFCSYSLARTSIRNMVEMWNS